MPWMTGCTLRRLCDETLVRSDLYWFVLVLSSLGQIYCSNSQIFLHTSFVLCFLIYVNQQKCYIMLCVAALGLPEFRFNNASHPFSLLGDICRVDPGMGKVDKLFVLLDIMYRLILIFIFIFNFKMPGCETTSLLCKEASVPAKACEEHAPIPSMPGSMRSRSDVISLCSTHRMPGCEQCSGLY